MTTLVDATTSSPFEAELSGYHTGSYAWKIEDARTKLQLEDPESGSLSSPDFKVGSFVCRLLLKTQYEESEWHVNPFIHITCPNNDALGAFGGCEFHVVNGQSNWIKSSKFGGKKFGGGVVCWGVRLFETADDVGSDLSVRADVHVKEVSVQEKDAAAMRNELYNILSRLNEPETQRRAQQAEQTQDSSEENAFQSSADLGSAGTGILNFGGNGCVKVRMPLVTKGEDRKRSLQQYMACHQLMLENPCTSFTWNAHVNSNEEIIVLHIEQSMVQQLPLLHSLQEATVADAAKPSAVCKQPTAKNDNKNGRTEKVIAAQNKEAQKLCATALPLRDCASFNPPASISGITILMMLLEGVVTAQQVFTCSCGPSLAVQVLWAASYLGHERMEKDVTDWLYCAVLSLLAADASTNSSDNNEAIVKVLCALKNTEQEWRQVFGWLPSDTVKTILTRLSTLLPDDSFKSNVLKLPPAIIHHWITSCNGVINLKAVSVTNVENVLQLLSCSSTHADVEMLHIPKLHPVAFTSEDVAKVLEILDTALPRWPNLRVLGLSNLWLSPQDMHQVVSILSVCRFHLQGVALTIPCWNGDARVLFQAIRKMPRLTTLQLDHWEENVATVDVTVLSPLTVLLPVLPSDVYVKRIATELPSMKFLAVPSS